MVYARHPAFYGEDYTTTLPGEMDGICTSSSCYDRPSKPRASYWDTHERRWVCIACAQARNMRALRFNVGKICIPAAERVVQLLTE